jgi:hypothetical protein
VTRGVTAFAILRTWRLRAVQNEELLKIIAEKVSNAFASDGLAKTNCETALRVNKE